MIKAISDRVFVRLEENKNPFGIIIDTPFNSRTIGTVESIGSQVTSVKVGDKILFHIFDELPTPDKDVVVLRESSILGVLNDD